MKKLILIYLLTFYWINANAQTGIGTSTPDASAKLDVSSTNKGFLPPRVTLTSGTDNTTIPSPATGLLVYNTGNNAGLVAGYYYWNGSSWATIATASGSGVSASFMRGSRSTAQTTGLSAGGLVAFNQTDNVSGQEISLNTSTGQITLAAGRTYRLIAQVPNFQTSSGDSRPQFGWYNETASAYIGSSSSAYASASTASYGVFGGISEAIITTISTTVISFRIIQTYNMTQIGGNADFSTSGAYPWFDIQVISGNSAVNGQSVDYVSVSRTGSDLTVNSGDVVIFNTKNSGNIQYNTSTGFFTLTAGKTYKLIASVSLSNGNTAAKEVNFLWKNAAGDELGARGELLSPSANVTASGSGVAYAVYTPLINTTVALYINYSTANTILWQNYSFASIEQIGSTAIVNPWILSGNNSYNTTGNVGIGTITPTEKLEVTGNVKADNFLGTASSSKLFLLEAYANVTYSLPGSYTVDPCRYSVVSNTVNVPSSWFNTSTYTFTPQKAGYWEIRASYDVYRNGEAALVISKNGSDVGVIGAISAVILIVNKVVYLNGSTDYIKINNTGYNSNSRSQGAVASWFQARWVGE